LIWVKISSLEDSPTPRKTIGAMRSLRGYTVKIEGFSRKAAEDNSIFHLRLTKPEEEPD
jgi:hypothetical protein